MKKQIKTRTYVFEIDEMIDIIDCHGIDLQFKLNLEFEIIDGYPAKTQAEPDECYPEQPTTAHFIGKNFETNFEKEYEIFSTKFKECLKRHIENNIIDEIEQCPEDWFELDDN